MDGDIDFRAVAGEVFVDGIVEDLEDAMVEAAFVCGPDIHSGALADACESLEFVDFRGVVFFGFGGGFGFVGHAGNGFWFLRVRHGCRGWEMLGNGRGGDNVFSRQWHRMLG